jgi:hypothetical protein
MYTVFNKSEAEIDIAHAVSWYESRQKGLGIRFITHLEKLYTHLENNPFLFPEKYPQVRQVPLRRFPYVLLYTIEDKNIFVLAVFNCYQNPKRKEHRLK